jgi:dTDP-4-amino-4,6-dideoxygalactose transaminase
MSIFSFQATKPLPGIEAGMGTYKQRAHYERASVFGDYKAPPLLPGDSPYRKYVGTGLGLKLRMHPLAAALCRKQLETLDERNAAIKAQVRRLNDRLTALPGILEPVCRKDCDRVYYSSNVVFFDEAKAGFSRSAALKALQAEGVRASAGDYPCQHKYAVYSEPGWWHHPPKVPAALPGSEQVNARAMNLPLFTRDVPELVDQYVRAFEKVWAHRQQLAKA